MRAANESVAAACSSRTSSSSSTQAGKKRGMYGAHSPELRAKIGRYAAENGNAACMRKYSKELNKTLNESTIRGMKSAYLKKLQSGEDVTSLPGKTRGRPLLIGNYWDEKVKAYVGALRRNGACVSSKIVIAGAIGLLKTAKPPVLVEHGGTVNLDKTWAKSILTRMGYSKRKGTKGVKNRPSNIDEIAGKFHRQIGRRIHKYKVPDELIINWNQTSVDVVPASNWTMNLRGEKQVPVKGTDDKRQYTSLLACTLSGQLLPPQIIYQGKTDQCHPHGVKWPQDWDVTHTETHWSTSESMLRYLDKIIVPYVEQTRQDLGLPNARPLLIFDLYRAHITEEVQNKLDGVGALYVYVPAACTDAFQPLDATVNAQYKVELKAQFSHWYANQVGQAMEDGLSLDDTAKAIDLRTTSIKPTHAEWLMRVHDLVRLNRDLIVKGFVETGILKAVTDARMGPVPALQDSDAEEGDWEEDEFVEI